MVKGKDFADSCERHKKRPCFVFAKPVIDISDLPELPGESAGGNECGGINSDR